MQKIIVEKNEAVADLIERILEAEDAHIRLVVPKRSHLLDSPNNFRLLAREAQVLQKSIDVESVDEDVLALAKEHGLASTHPLFDERTSEDSEPISDIRPGKRKASARGKAEAAAMAGQAVPLKVQYNDEFTDGEESEDEEDVEEEEEAVSDNGSEDERYDTISDYRERSSGRRVGVVVIAAFLVVLVGLWAFGAMFGKAEVAIRFKKTPYSFNDQVAALTSVKDMDLDRHLIPGQLFEEEKSLVQSFPASGRGNVNDKAKGTITIVNAFSSASQELVASTRFETPDGKIFRLDSGVVVPGAKVDGGKITPSSIKAPVTADVAGPSGNVGRTDKLTIPGFKGSPRYEGFYGVLENGTSGGQTGERAIATDEDIEGAKSKVNEVLRSAFNTSFLGAIPGDIKVLDGASSLTPGKISVDRTAGSDGKFTLTGAAVFDAFGFREGDLMSFLVRKAGAGDGMELQNAKLSYENIRPDFAKKELKFSLKAEGEIAPSFNAEEFKDKIAGQKKGDARNVILGLSELQSAEVKLWPAWLRSLPSNARRITIEVQ